MRTSLILLGAMPMAGCASPAPYAGAPITAAERRLCEYEAERAVAGNPEFVGRAVGRARVFEACMDLAAARAREAGRTKSSR